MTYSVFLFFVFWSCIFIQHFILTIELKAGTRKRFNFSIISTRKGSLCICVCLFKTVVWSFKSKSYDTIELAECGIVLCGIYNFYLEIPLYFFLNFRFWWQYSVIFNNMNTNTELIIYKCDRIWTLFMVFLSGRCFYLSVCLFIM